MKQLVSVCMVQKLVLGLEVVFAICINASLFECMMIWNQMGGLADTCPSKRESLPFSLQYNNHNSVVILLELKLSRLSWWDVNVLCFVSSFPFFYNRKYISFSSLDDSDQLKWKFFFFFFWQKHLHRSSSLTSCLFTKDTRRFILNKTQIHIDNW